MFDDEVVKQRIEKRLEAVKQWKDEYGIIWCEVNGQKVPKKQLIIACMEKEKEAMLNENFGFLQF